jgi:hypothetical protein
LGSPANNPDEKKVVEGHVQARVGLHGKSDHMDASIFMGKGDIEMKHKKVIFQNNIADHKNITKTSKNFSPYILQQ